MSAAVPRSMRRLRSCICSMRSCSLIFLAVLRRLNILVDEMELEEERPMVMMGERDGSVGAC